AAQNESVVIQAEILGVGEDDFAELDRLRIEAGDAVLHAVLLRGLLKHPSELEEALPRMELIGPKDELAADVFGRMDGHAVGIRSRLELRNAAHPAGSYRLSTRNRFGCLDPGRYSYSARHTCPPVVLSWNGLVHQIVTKVGPNQKLAKFLGLGAITT